MKDISIWMQSSKEQQGAIRKPFSVINAKKQGKQQNGKDQKSLEENQRYQGTFHTKMNTIKERNDMDLTEAGDTQKGGKNTQKKYAKEILMAQIITIV